MKTLIAILTLSLPCLGQEIRTDKVTSYATTNPGPTNAASLTHKVYSKNEAKEIEAVLAKVPIVNAAKASDHPEWGLIQLFWHASR